ncbi:MAG: lysine biosynthesis protein LysW [Promethearchaeota archaeon]
MGKKLECPACFYEWETEDEDLIAGEIINCPDCGLDLEIIEIGEEEIKLEKVDATEEDWGE